MVRRSREIIYPVMLYGHKREIFYCAFSCLEHGPYIRRSNLANCKFILELVIKLATVPRRTEASTEGSKGGDSKRDSLIEPVVSSIAQGPAKNTIKVD